MSVFEHALSADTELVKARTVSMSDQPGVLTDIYRDEYNIVIWQRAFSPSLAAAIDALLLSNKAPRVAREVTPQSVLNEMCETLQGFEYADELSENIAELVDMFCCLFDQRYAGLRLTSLQTAMCPRFHVDKVPCRLVTTYQGRGTQWLSHQCVDRTKLGAGNQGLPDECSGLYKNSNDIRQLGSGDVALLKGELWEGNENAGLVHRSPALEPGERRLLLTLDLLS